MPIGLVAILLLLSLCILGGCQFIPLSLSFNYKDTLIKLDVIGKDEVTKDAFITNFEVLDVIRKIVDCDQYAHIESWYQMDSLEPLDYLDDDIKLLMLGLCISRIVSLDDMNTVILDNNATYFEALTFMSRMIDDYYDGFALSDEINLTQKPEVYQFAYKKGLISYKSTNNADSPIPRKEFYKIIYRTINVTYAFYGYGLSKSKYIYDIKDRIKNPPESEEAILLEPTEISVTPVINNDLSITWTLPAEYAFLSGKNAFVDFELTELDGKIVGYISKSLFMYDFNGIDADSLIASLVRAYPERPNYIRCTCIRYNYYYSRNEEWFFNIDISKINVVVEGEEIMPGIFTAFKSERVPETITLAGNQRFKANAYYLITSYSHWYRKAEYNFVSNAIFKVDNYTDIIRNEDGQLNLNIRDLYLGDMHLQEIIVLGNADIGFTLSVTPESKAVFTVEEGFERKY
jgi:hypothetical protein